MGINIVKMLLNEREFVKFEGDRPKEYNTRGRISHFSPMIVCTIAMKKI